MSDLLQAAALVCTAFGLLSAGIVLAGTRDLRAAARVLLDFLLAAVLLPLGGEPSWPAIGAAAAVVALRRLLRP